MIGTHLDRLIIHQRINRNCRPLIIRRIRLLPEPCPPCSRRDGEPSIGGHGDGCDGGEGPAEFPALPNDNGISLEKLVCRWSKVRRFTRIPQTIVTSSAVGITWKTIELNRNVIPLHNRPISTSTSINISIHRPPPLPSAHPPPHPQHSLNPPIQRPQQPPRLPIQMKRHIHRQQVTERVPRDLTDGSLGDGREDCVAEFGEEGGEDAGEAVCDASGVGDLSKRNEKWGWSMADNR